MPIVSTFVVDRMTDETSESEVTAEILTLPGVQTVSVDLAAGGESRLTIVGSEHLDLNTVGLAVDEAGCVLIGVAPELGSASTVSRE